MPTTTSVAFAPIESSQAHEASAPPWCPKCGTKASSPALQTLKKAQARIAELESQVKILTLRATSAVERANEYEASLHRLNQSIRKSPAAVQREAEPIARSPSTAVPPSGAAGASPAALPGPTPIRSQFARLLTRSASTASAPPSTAPLNHPSNPAPLHTPLASHAHPATAGLPPTEMSLMDALTQERALRQAAESAAAQTSNEIEELTGQLFEQANEMVATERKARARLEEWVKLLERRDGEKTKRLGVLERRILRVERVRNLLEREKELELEKSRTSTPKDPPHPP